MLAACGGGQAIAPVGSYKAQNQQTASSVYKVQSGDTLYSVSWRF